MTESTSGTSNTDGVRVAPAELRKLLSEILSSVGVYAADADLAADQMVRADLVGESSRGSEMIHEFLDAIDMGDIDPRAQGLTLVDTPALTVLDGCAGVGAATAAKGMQLALTKAESLGTGTVLIKNGRPSGPPTHIARLAAEAGMVGCCTFSQGPAVNSWAETEKPVLANNSWGWSVPLQDGESLDMELTSPVDHASGQGWALIAPILTGAMVGSKMPIRKNANVYSQGVEYFLFAINPEVVGDRERFIKELQQTHEVISPARSSTHELQQQLETQGIPLTGVHQQKLEAVAKRKKLDCPW